jgi:hypothetical protein
VTEICPRHPTHLLDPHDSRLLTNQVPDDAGDNNIRRGFSAPKSGPAARTSLESGNHIPLTAPPLHRYAVIGGRTVRPVCNPAPRLGRCGEVAGGCCTGTTHPPAEGSWGRSLEVAAVAGPAVFGVPGAVAAHRDPQMRSGVGGTDPRDQTS